MKRNAKYRIRCNTENDWVHTDFMDSVPTQCPNDPSHIINQDSTTLEIYESLDINDYVIDSELNYALDETDETTSSQDYQEKVRLHLTDLPYSKYKIAFYAEVKETQESETVGVQCMVNDIEVAQVEVSDNITVDYESFSGFAIVELSGTVDIKINWRQTSATSTGVAHCRRGRIEITKSV